jgi:hypothetical protein
VLDWHVVRKETFVMNMIFTPAPTEPLDEIDWDRVRMLHIVTPDIRQAREVALAIGHSSEGLDAALVSMDNPTLRGFLLGQDRYEYAAFQSIDGYFLALKFYRDSDLSAFDTLASLAA